jgi:acetyl-CoA C-acetyltransferase
VSDRVAIAGLAQTKFEEQKPAQGFSELAYEVVEKVLAQTGLTIEADIDSTVTASQDFWDGRTISDIPIGDVAGGHLRPEEKVAMDSAQAVYYATIQILSGHYDVVLVVTHCKESQACRSVIENAAFDPLYQRIIGFDFLAAAALQARRYMYKYGITEAQCAKVAVKNLKNAQKNPHAQRSMDLRVEQVLNSPLVASPIHQLETKPQSDGACAVILAGEEKARQITDKPVWVRGLGSCYDGYYLGDRDLADCQSLILAAQRAYKMAGIKNPLREVHVAEVSEEYAHQELLWYEGLGFCDRGEGGKLIDRGVTEMGGKLPVNPSGGILAGNPTTVAGMVRVAEAALQLRGEAGERQVPNARTAIAHGQSGYCGQHHCVLILGSD